MLHSVVPTSSVQSYNMTRVILLIIIGVVHHISVHYLIITEEKKYNIEILLLLVEILLVSSYNIMCFYDWHTHMNINILCIILQRGRGQWAVHYTSPQSFIITFSNSMAQQLLGLLIGCLIKLSVQMFQPLILIYRRCTFVYHYWRCTSICRPLSFPFRFQIAYQPSLNCCSGKSCSIASFEHESFASFLDLPEPSKK